MWIKVKEITSKVLRVSQERNASRILNRNQSRVKIKRMKKKKDKCERINNKYIIVLSIKAEIYGARWEVKSIKTAILNGIFNTNKWPSGALPYYVSGKVRLAGLWCSNLVASSPTVEGRLSLTLFISGVCVFPQARLPLQAPSGHGPYWGAFLMETAGSWSLIFPHTGEGLWPATCDSRSVKSVFEGGAICVWDLSWDTVLKSLWLQDSEFFAVSSAGFSILIFQDLYDPVYIRIRSCRKLLMIPTRRDINTIIPLRI